MNGQKYIVIIDDDEQIREMLKQILAREGYGIFVAANGKEGMQIYREKQTDLVITDIIMPEKDGLETITELRKDFPEVKIIAMSGGGSKGPESNLQAAKRLGAVCTLTKPVRRKEMLSAVKELINPF